MADDKISTTALAKKMEVPVQQLFGMLKEYDWIRKVADGWALTPKGEFEGGQYKHSKRYGRYIVWPVTLEEHAMFKALDANRMLSASKLGEPYMLSGRAVNRVLAELGWLQRQLHGWELTDNGKKQGGVQMENRQTDMLYALWPESIQENPVLVARLQESRAASEVVPDDDLFANAAAYDCVDGHSHKRRACLAICHWLYMAGVLHATNRTLPVAEHLTADFFLPMYQVYIDFWAADASPAELRASMRKSEIYKEKGMAFIELHPEDIEQLDDIMPRQLQRFDVAFI